MRTDNSHLWVIVLAAGNGTRVAGYTKDARGEAAPKQFCCFKGEHSMLQWALRRARAIVPEKRIVTIVAKQHEAWWQNELSGDLAQNRIVQPLNRGTAPGILLPLLHILSRDRKARVVVLPSDHYVAHEKVLHDVVANHVHELEHYSNRLFLLGITPDILDPCYGWIVPKADANAPSCEVARFVEKPDLEQAKVLYRQGALWNSFMFLAKGSLLLSLYGCALPDLFQTFLLQLGDASSLANESLVQRVYESLPSFDFSRHVLEFTSEYLRVVPVPPCGWSDLGTPERLARYLHQDEELIKNPVRRRLAEQSLIC